VSLPRTESPQGGAVREGLGRKGGFLERGTASEKTEKLLPGHITEKKKKLTAKEGRQDCRSDKEIWLGIDLDQGTKKEGGSGKE